MTKPTERLAVTPSQARALMNGATQLRCPVDPQPPTNVTSVGTTSWTGNPRETNEWSWLSGDPKDPDTWGFEGDYSPPYQPGERLFVAEEWWQGQYNYTPDAIDPPTPEEPAFFFKAEEPHRDVEWRPATAMPEWAARMLVTIKAAAIERNEVGEWEVVYDVEVERR